MRGLKLARAQKFFCNAVASFTDAWIETSDNAIKMSALESHLLQMRGLKRIIGYYIDSFFDVASFTDAWIETK